MADATGILSKMGVKDVAAWTTAYAAADEIIPYESESLTPQFTRIADPSLVGTAGRAASDQGVQAITGDTVHVLDYNNFDTILETIFGAISTRTFTISNDALLKYLWMEIEKTAAVWRFGACKATKMVLSGEKDQHVKLTVSWVARDVAYAGAGGFPGGAALTGARTKVRFEDLDFWIIDIASGPPDAGDRQRIESFELEMDRALIADDYASKDGSSGEKFPLEPIPNDFRVTSFKFKIPRYDSTDTMVGWKDADTPIQAKLTFTRSAESITIDLPDLRITEGADAQISGPGRIQNDVTCECYYPEAGNPLYTGGEVQLVVV